MCSILVCMSMFVFLNLFLMPRIKSYEWFLIYAFTKRIIFIKFQTKWKNTEYEYFLDIWFRNILFQVVRYKIQDRRAVTRMGFKGVPDRWEDYSNSGNVVKGTRYETQHSQLFLNNIGYLFIELCIVGRFSGFDHSLIFSGVGRGSL